MPRKEVHGVIDVWLLKEMLLSVYAQPSPLPDPATQCSCTVLLQIQPLSAVHLPEFLMVTAEDDLSLSLFQLLELRGL